MQYAQLPLHFARIRTSLTASHAGIFSEYEIIGQLIDFTNVFVHLTHVQMAGHNKKLAQSIIK